jgi:crotonobetainyl-CoA:carnitine CoA-transferase CaiB-like acyl-CoA transferase
MSDLLSGIRVIESAVLLNGDSLGMLLGDMGADVIKVESPGRGDYIRDFLGQITPRNSVIHLQVNKNKRSVAIDLKSDAGRQVFWALQATADVFVDGNRAGACERLGIGYNEQSARRPGIVYVHYTGFGSNGPYAGIPAHGMMMGALAGAHHYARAEDGFMHQSQSDEDGTETGGEATSVGAAHAAMHTCAALVQRIRSGRGCYIDVAASDAVVMSAWPSVDISLNRHRITDTTGMVPRSGGEMQGAKYQFYATGDDKILLFACIEPKFWANFCRAVGWPDEDDSSEDGPVQFGTDPDLRRALQDLFLTRTLAEWVALAAKHDIAMGPAHQGVAEMAADPQILARELIIEGEHPVAGPFTYLGTAGRVSDQPYRVRRPAPTVGEHTRELLEELGYDGGELDRLHEAGIIG